MRTFLSNALTMVKSLFGAGDEKDRTIETLEIMKEKVLVARDQLMDAEKTQFVKVMIPTMMSVFETERLADELNMHVIDHKYSVINMINPENKNCQYCSQRREEHLKNVEYIKTLFAKDKIVLMEAFDTEIRGLEMLRKFGAELIS